MATSRTVMFGTTHCRIETRFHVDIRGSQHPAIAIAFVDGDEVTANGEPVERVGSTEEQAAAEMSAYLTGRFGPMNADPK